MGRHRRLIVLLTMLAAGSSAAADRTQLERPAVDISRKTAEIKLHPAGLAELIDSIGGRNVMLPRARVVAVINPRAFLVESASSLLSTSGNLDRVLVLIHAGALRVDHKLLTGSNVRVRGVARSLLGIQMTAEVPWPPELGPEVVKRLEIRAAVLATSVQTPDGVSLTN